MKAVAYQTAHELNQPSAGLTDVVLPIPHVEPNQVLVEIKAISVNPIDTKVRRSFSAADGQFKVLGWDATGVVKEVGENVVDFKIGDAVWYAGDLNRQGSNAQYQVVDARIVSKMPTTVDFTTAAAMPLTSITAWELLFDRLNVPKNSAGVIVIVGAAGGVGSILVQLARQLTELTVVATASRPESVAWVSELGAHHVINHALPLSEELQRISFSEADYVIGLTNTDQHIAEIAKMIAPQGKFALIDDPKNVDITLFKRKSVSIHWESMFTRSTFATADMAEQGQILAKVAELVDQGKLRSTVKQSFGVINADNIKRAHGLLESGASIGKIVLADF